MMIPSIGIGPLGAGEWSVAGISSLKGTGGVTATSGSDSFGAALSKAIGSLENTQATATADSKELATGQLSDPTTAVTAVENATLSMDYASQIRNSLDTDASTLFQTSV
jgi:flagellar hook-basal body complex protein FliE